MEGFVTEDKYRKLAGEYAKLRAQASVLKKALLEDQAKSTALRDQLKQKETTLRRSEQEIDSLGFRNKQLEHRVASLQDDLAISEIRKKAKKSSKKRNTDKLDEQQVNLIVDQKDGSLQEPLIYEELQKKIMENAELASLIDDQERSMQMHTEHIKNMEQMLEKRNFEHEEVEKRLRKDIEMLQIRNQELETKVVEAASMLGSEDALSASGSDYISYHNNNQIPQAMAADCRITNLEKEVAHWRSQYELTKVYVDKIHIKPSDELNIALNTKLLNCSCTTTAAGISSISSCVDNKRDSKTEHIGQITKELLLFNNLGLKFEDLLKEKLFAESRLDSFATEVDHLQNCLENATHELKCKDEQLDSINKALHLLEEDMTTTRINYDEQISVLTEQIINLSEQLAASK